MPLRVIDPRGVRPTKRPAARRTTWPQSPGFNTGTANGAQRVTGGPAGQLLHCEHQIPTMPGSQRPRPRRQPDRCEYVVPSATTGTRIGSPCSPVRRCTRPAVLGGTAHVAIDRRPTTPYEANSTWLRGE